MSNDAHQSHIASKAAMQKLAFKSFLQHLVGQVPPVHAHLLLSTLKLVPECMLAPTQDADNCSARGVVHLQDCCFAASDLASLCILEHAQAVR